MFEKLRLRIDEWLDQPKPGGLADSLMCLRAWWRARPKRVTCAACWQTFWAWNHKRVPNSDFVCSRECEMVMRHLYATGQRDDPIPF